MFETLDNLYWIEELLPPDVISIPKHGGMAYFLDTKMILILVEQADSSYEHKGVTYPFPLWNGLILPIEYKKQNALFLKYSFLENHPVSKDWLYIPASSENFEEEVRLVMREISKNNPLIGLYLKSASTPRVKAVDGAEKKKKPAPKKVKASKKQENDFFLKLANRKK
ncbi:hypothetical protein [Bdellovibrio sp. NC01]|uniref:hypothetical protein n=1 Tax=Bdellovibrio sp. NC01 TaxID=2220073 RepID=UPI001156FE3B|nr:hypothetical protein [Bdellovibrio sp. NC01]QDK38619.1 hypothetical protein DOE51_14030 [Bdellovibrio sp. NC01]